MGIQTERLLGVSIHVPSDSSEYLDALEAANEGDLIPLSKYLKSCVTASTIVSPTQVSEQDAH
jgi:hypothetical protein